MFVYQEVNANHEFDYFEQMLPNWQIVVKNTLTGQAQSLVSDARGSVYFTNLAPGAYSVCERLKPGWVNLGCYTTNVVSGQNATFWFGNTTGF